MRDRVISVAQKSLCRASKRRRQQSARWFRGDTARAGMLLGHHMKSVSGGWLLLSAVLLASAAASDAASGQRGDLVYVDERADDANGTSILTVRSLSQVAANDCLGCRKPTAANGGKDHHRSRHLYVASFEVSNCQMTGSTDMQCMLVPRLCPLQAAQGIVVCERPKCDSRLAT